MITKRQRMSLEPLTSAAVVLRTGESALPHAVSLVSAFLDPTPAWSVDRACERGDLRLLRRVAALEALRSRAADPFYRAFLAAKGLVAAARNDDLEVARWLCLEYCPSVVPVKAMGEAAALGRLRTLRWLFETYPSVRPNRYVADKAAMSGDLDTLQLVLQYFEVPVTDEDVECLLSAAARVGNLEMVRWLHEQQCVLNRAVGRRDDEHLDKTALRNAIRQGHLEIAQFLDDQGYTLASWQRGRELASCACRGNLEMIEWLHAKQYTHDSSGWIGVAASAGHLHIIKWVHENLPSEVCNEGTMERASGAGYLEIVQWLHANRTEKWSKSAMDNAANYSLEIVQWLHENRSEGCTTHAMDGAADSGHLDIVQWLHEHRTEGCSTKAMDGAAGHGHLDIVQWLHEHRTEGCTKTAMDHAAGRGHLHVVQWLHANRTEGCSQAAMDLAAINGHLHVVKWLHENRSEGCSVSGMDRTNSVEVLRWLLDNRSEGCSYYAMMNAVSAGNFEGLLFLKEKGLDYVPQRAIVQAVEHGQFEILQWLRATYSVDVDIQATARRMYSPFSPDTIPSWEMFCQFESRSSLEHR